MFIDRICEPSDIYASLRKSTEAELYRNQLLEAKVSRQSFKPEDYADAIGSFDATSCLGCIFTAKNGRHVVSFHHDGRPLGNLFHLFSQYKGETLDLDIAGGIQKRDRSGALSSDYSLVDDSTRENFESLLGFTRYLSSTVSSTVNFRSWTIGDATKEGLVSEYLARPGRKITLLETGTLHEKCLPPEFFGRKARILIPEGIQVVYDATSSKNLFLNGVSRYLYPLRDLAHKILSYSSDKELLAKRSTTPEMEPSYYCDAQRKMADFLLSDQAKKYPQGSYPLPENTPCIILQGEAGRICQ
jgi:hypothetical protein